jgi:tetratricopeptide (TPR) repeat protein
MDAKLLISPGNPSTLAARGELRRLLGEYAAAEADFAAALALDPGLVDVELYRARLFHDSGRHEEAIDAATRYLLASPSGAPLRVAALVVRSRAHRDLGDLEAALTDLDRALAPPHRPTAELVLERVDILRSLLLAQEPPPAVAERVGNLLVALDDGMAILGPAPALQLPAIELELESGSVDRALARLDTLRAQADVADAWLEREGDILLAAGRRPEAASAYALALRELRRRPSASQSVPATADRKRRLDERLSALAGSHPTLEPRTSLSLPERGPLPGLVLSRVELLNGGTVELSRGPYLQLATETSVVVRWRTDAPASSWVAWGLEPGNLGLEMMDPDPVVEHEINVTGLEPDTCYVYEIGTIDEILAGGDLDHLLCTRPAESFPIRVWVIGDSGTADANAAAVRDAYLGFFSDPRPDVWLMLGDNAYPSGTDDEYQAAVFEMYPTTLAHAVVWPAFGNHDAASSDSGSQTGPYFDSFSLPAGGEAGGMISGTEAYYAFDHGPAHFICLDSAGFTTPTQAMLDWLVADLDSTDKEWIVVYFHHPPYSKGSHDSDNPDESGGRLFAMREMVGPIIEDHGVDLVLAGHSHSYERSVLINGHYGTSDTLTPDMIIDGGDGSPLGDGPYVKDPGPRPGTVYAVAGSSGKTSGGPLDHPVMHISLNELGSMVLFIDPAGLEAIFLDADADPVDLFRIEKSVVEIFRDGFESGDTSAWSSTVQ